MLSGGVAVPGAFSTPGANEDEPGTVGAEAAFGSVDRSVGGDDGKPGTPGIDCMPGTPGKENIPATSGNDGVAVRGAIFSKSRKYAEDPGVDGDDVAGIPGANDGTFPSDAGIARRSASVNGVTRQSRAYPECPAMAVLPARLEKQMPRLAKETSESRSAVKCGLESKPVNRGPREIREHLGLSE